MKTFDNMRTVFLLFIFLSSTISCRVESYSNRINKQKFKNATKHYSVFNAYDFFRSNGVVLNNNNDQKVYFIYTDTLKNTLMAKFNNKYFQIDIKYVSGLGNCFVTRSESLPDCEGTWSKDTIFVNPHDSLELLISKDVKRARIFYSFRKSFDDTNKVVIKEYCILSKTVKEKFDGHISSKDWLKLSDEQKDHFLLYECNTVLKNNFVVGYGKVFFTGDCICEMFTKFGDINRFDYRDKHISYLIIRILANFWG